MGQLMASSGSSSRKGFPEAGGECCQPRDRKKWCICRAMGVDALPLGWPRTLASSKPACKPEPALPGQGWRNPCGWPGEEASPLHREPLSHRPDTPHTQCQPALTALLGTRTELPPPRGSEWGSALPRSHLQEVTKLQTRNVTIPGYPGVCPQNSTPGDLRQSRVCTLRAGVRAIKSSPVLPCSPRAE